MDVNLVFTVHYDAFKPLKKEQLRLSKPSKEGRHSLEHLRKVPTAQSAVYLSLHVLCSYKKSLKKEKNIVTELRNHNESFLERGIKIFIADLPLCARYL